MESKILSEGAKEFLSALHQEFNPRRLALLAERNLLQKRLDAGENPHFLLESAP